MTASLVSRDAVSGATTLTTTAGTTATGDALVVFGSGEQYPSSISDSKGNTYTLATSFSYGPIKMWAYVCKPGDSGYVGGGSSHTVTVNYSATDYPVVHFIRVPNVISSGSLDVVLASDVATAATRVKATGTLAQADEVVLAAISQASSEPTSVTSSNLTILSEEHDGGLYWPSSVGGTTVSSTASLDCDFTYSPTGGATEIIVILTFKLSAGGGISAGVNATLAAATLAATATAAASPDRSAVVSATLADVTLAATATVRKAGRARPYIMRYFH